MLGKHARHLGRIGNLLAVYPYRGAVVNAFKYQLEKLAFICRRHFKGGAVPVRLFPGIGVVWQVAVLLQVVLFVELVRSIGYQHVVEALVWVGINFVGNQTSEHG
jgi:hypothetical protein